MYLPGLIRKEVQDCVFQMVLPIEWNSTYKPVCIHFAGTGDHYFWRRRKIMAEPLLKEGIGAIILENPYYGTRKPKDQIRSSLHYVSDIFVMGGCLILEGLVLLHWCEKLGLGPLGVTGISMGGHMASLAASNWPRPLVLVPCLSWSSASSVFTEGVMSESIDWDMLQEQFMSDSSYSDDLSKLCTIVDNPFACDLFHLPDKLFNSSYLPLKGKDVANITPYQLINLKSCATCPDIVLRPPTESVEKMSSNSSSVTNFFKSPVQIKLNKVDEMKKRDSEAIWFMRGIMDECTHLKNFSVPFDTSLIISICASADGYVPRTGLSHLEDIWPGATVKYVDCGHVGAYIWHRNIFRESIIEAFERAKKKYKPLSAQTDNL
nr:protein ABHD18 [Leptinotarsa decemlineata]